jgi:multicomponent K+:H+ antiporter subunit E
MNSVWRRVLPAPLLSLVLLIAWPVLNQSFSLGHWVLGAMLAVAIPWWTERLRPERPRLRRVDIALRLTATVLWDIVVSNLQVARRILGREDKIKPGYVWIPLSIQDPHGKVVLASIITMTPGTLSAGFTPTHSHLLVHCFHVDKAQDIIQTCKSRYEAPLMEIFQ